MIAQGKNIENLKVKDLATRTIVSAYPDETLREVLQRMIPRDLSRMPVASRQDPRKLVGVIRRRNVIKAYDMGLVRRGFALGSLPGSPPGSATGRFPVPQNSYLVGKTLAELCLPDDFLVIHLERDGKVIMPHGITRLEAGDTLTLLSHHGNVAKLDAFWQEIIQRPMDDSEEEPECFT